MNFFEKECIFYQTYSPAISPCPSLLKRGIPPFGKGRKREI
jgi:hypothetical protein